MKRFTQIVSCVLVIIIISILFCQIYSYGVDTSSQNKFKLEKKIVTITQYKSKTSEKILWKYLSKYCDNEKIVAGILGYFNREGQLRSDAIAGWPQRDQRQYCNSSWAFTQKVDAGLADGSTKKYFMTQVHIHLGGYGLGQWEAVRFLNTFYDFAQKWGTSIADAEMQCAYTVWSMQHQTPGLWKQIQNEKDVTIIGRKIGHLYDGTNDLGSNTIASYAQEYYKKYAGK